MVCVTVRPATPSERCKTREENPRLFLTWRAGAKRAGEFTMAYADVRNVLVLLQDLGEVLDIEGQSASLFSE